jgi:hypothetical protein
MVARLASDCINGSVATENLDPTGTGYYDASFYKDGSGGDLNHTLQKRNFRISEMSPTAFLLRNEANGDFRTLCFGDSGAGVIYKKDGIDYIIGTSPGGASLEVMENKPDDRNLASVSTVIRIDSPKMCEAFIQLNIAVDFCSEDTSGP